MIRGIGVDIIKIQRLRKSVENSGQRFLKRVFTPDEIAYCTARRDPYPSFAARFAAKEAFIKALPQSTRIAVRDVEVTLSEDRKPSIVLSRKVAEILGELGVNAVHLSMSHEKDYAVAHVVLEGEEE